MARPRNAGPFTGLGVALMIGIGCVAMLAAIGVASVATNLRDGAQGGGHALSRSAIGYAGLVRLLNDSDVPARVGRDDLKSRPNTQGLLILTPELPGGAPPLKGLHHAGPVLIILPKWFGLADPKHAGWVFNGGPVASDAIARSVLAIDSQVLEGRRTRSDDRVRASLSRDTGVQRPVLVAGQGLFAAGTRLDFGPVATLQTLAVDGWSPTLVDGRGRGLLLRARASQIYVLSDPDLVSNHGLASLQSARSAVALIGALRGDQRPVIFDVSLNGFSRPRSLLSTFLRPPLLPATLCALAAAILMGRHAAVRFGPARAAGRAIALGKTALLDTSAAVIHRARRAPRMAPRFAALTRDIAAKSVGAPSRLSVHELDALLDRLTATEPGRTAFTALADRAAKVATLEELLVSSRELFEWRMGVTHDSR